MGPLRRLDRRVRWKRWLGKLHRFTWMLALTFLAVFLTDWLFGLRTLSLRIAFGIMGGMAIALFATDWIAAWLVKGDLLGLAQLLEKRYPDLAERLVTLVQIQTDKSPSEFMPLLQAETEQRLAAIEPDEACSLRAERKKWMRTTMLLCGVFVGLAFVPAFGSFSSRIFMAWGTPLVPIEIEVIHGNGYALRGGTYSVGARFRILDANAELPEKCELIYESEAGVSAQIAMTATSEGEFAAMVENLQQPMRCKVQAGEAVSAPFDVGVIDVPAFSVNPTIEISPPSYLRSDGTKVRSLDESAAETSEILRFSKMRIRWSLDRMPVQATLRVKTVTETGDAKPEIALLPVAWNEKGSEGTVETVAAAPGKYEAEVLLSLEHGLSAVLPLGQWAIRDDQAPRFTRPLRLQGGEALSSQREYRIAPDDALRLQTEIADDEGLDAVSIEWRINDAPSRIEKWLSAAGKKTLAINEWLPAPKDVKEGDRVRFRIHASDNRRLKKGEVLRSAGAVVPGEDLLPQVAVAPAGSADDDAWITLRIDRSLESFLKAQAQAQSDEVRDAIEKIKEKLKKESDQVQELQRTTHQQPVLTPAQLQQAEKLQALNREITDDLARAGQRFGAVPELAGLAEHFLGIAETEMRAGAAALERFRAKSRPLPDAEKDLQAARDALAEARKKLDRMLAWDKMLAQDRLDQFQLDKLAKTQNDLAERLAKLLAQPALSEQEKAKEIEAIRQEQAKIAERMAKLQEQSKFAQDSLAALDRMRVERLAKQAEQLAADQRAGREMAPAKMPAEIKARLAKLAEQQTQLAANVTPFAKKNQGPDVKSAAAAGDALKKPQIEQAIAKQREHEKRLQDWLDQLLPSTAANSLREQVLRLAKKQKEVRADFEKLGADLARLQEKMVLDRLSDLVARQQQLAGAIAKLPIPDKEARLRPAQKRAELAAQQAGDRLAVKDALQAYNAMEQSQKELDALARMMPATMPVQRADIKDPMQRAKLEQIESFAAQQEKIRSDTERLQSDWLKASAGSGEHPLKEKADKLAADLMELSQKGARPEAKAMAKENAQAVDQAKKAMEASQTMKAKGDVAEAKKMDDDAAGKLDIVAKKLAKLSQDPPLNAMPKETAEKIAAALKEGAKEMRKADEDLPAQPKNAENAMKAAAKSLAQASSEFRPDSKFPKTARNPAARSTMPDPGGFPGLLPKDAPVEFLKGKAWGDLPGEMKTRMLQDYGARFGADYAEMIRDYFDRLAQTPAPARKD